MFHIFSKKYYLVDYLKGFVDIHNHILPNIDDGAKDVNESITLLKAFGEFGVNNFICTPHIMSDYYENTPKTIKKAHEILVKEIDNQKLNEISIGYAAEHMIDANFDTILEQEEFLPLSKNHILIEMSYLQPSINFENAIKNIQSKGYFPIFAHPERYQYLISEYSKYRLLKQKDIQFQLNMLSLSNYYGTNIKKTAMKLLEDDLYTFIASDVHNSKHLLRLKETVVSKKVLSKLHHLINNTIQNFY